MTLGARGIVGMPLCPASGSPPSVRRLDEGVPLEAICDRGERCCGTPSLAHRWRMNTLLPSAVSLVRRTHGKELAIGD